MTTKVKSNQLKETYQFLGGGYVKSVTAGDGVFLYSDGSGDLKISVGTPYSPPTALWFEDYFDITNGSATWRDPYTADATGNVWFTINPTGTPNFIGTGSQTLRLEFNSQYEGNIPEELEIVIRNTDGNSVVRYMGGDTTYNLNSGDYYHVLEVPMASIAGGGDLSEIRFFQNFNGFPFVVTDLSFY